MPKAPELTPSASASDLLSLPDGVPAALSREVRTAAIAAVRGGHAAMRFYENECLEVKEKHAGDPVTEADLASNSAILQTLQTAFPSDPILSEEAPPIEGAADAQRLWVVDPLDGTKEFISRNGEFCVMVGLAHNGAALLGATYEPASDLLLVGISDVGAWWTRCSRRPDGDIPEIGELSPLRLKPGVAFRTGTQVRTGTPVRVRLTRSRSHPDERLQALEDRIPGATIIRSGSVGVKCSLIARDRADVYAHPVPFLKEWDTCAPEAVLRGAGGKVTDCAGQPLRYGKQDPSQPGGIFAGRPRVWESLLPVVREVSASLFR